MSVRGGGLCRIERERMRFRSSFCCGLRRNVRRRPVTLRPAISGFQSITPSSFSTSPRTAGSMSFRRVAANSSCCLFLVLLRGLVHGSREVHQAVLRGADPSHLGRDQQRTSAPAVRLEKADRALMEHLRRVLQPLASRGRVDAEGLSVLAGVYGNARRLARLGRSHAVELRHRRGRARAVALVGARWQTNCGASCPSSTR